MGRTGVASNQSKIATSAAMGDRSAPSPAADATQISFGVPGVSPASCSPQPSGLFDADSPYFFSRLGEVCFASESEASFPEDDSRLGLQTLAVSSKFGITFFVDAKGTETLTEIELRW
eukprot:scaffold50651_cov32-Prasinocladus_malaysianus.AAC.1